MSITGFTAQSFGTFPDSGSYVGNAVENANSASLRHLASTSTAPDSTTFSGAATTPQSIGHTAQNPDSKANQQLAVALGLGIPGAMLIVGAAAYGLHRFSTSQTRSMPMVSRKHRTAQNTVDKSPAAAVAAKISPTEEKSPLLDRQEPKSPKLGATIPAPPQPTLTANPSMPKAQNAAPLKSALRPSPDRTFPTPRNGSEPSRVRFTDAAPEVREYSPFELGKEKPLKHKKPDLTKTRKLLSLEALTERLPYPDTKSMSEAEKMLVFPIKSQKDLDAAFQRAQDPAAMEDWVKMKYQLRIAKGIRKSVATDDLRLFHLTKVAGQRTSVKADAFLQLGIKDPKNSRITHPELLTARLTRNAALYKAVKIAHDRLILTSPKLPLSDVEQQKIDTIRRKASVALDQRIKEKEERLGDKAKTATYRKLLENIQPAYPDLHFSSLALSKC